MKVFVPPASFNEANVAWVNYFRRRQRAFGAYHLLLTELQARLGFTYDPKVSTPNHARLCHERGVLQIGVAQVGANFAIGMRTDNGANATVSLPIADSDLDATSIARIFLDLLPGCESFAPA